MVSIFLGKHLSAKSTNTKDENLHINIWQKSRKLKRNNSMINDALKLIMQRNNGECYGEKNKIA